MRKSFQFAAFAALIACTTSGYAAPKPKAISYQEASEFEQSLLARQAVAPAPPEKLYVQPANKAEPCKLPTTRNQLERSNLRVYWDGDCRNGFAFGLGRDIAMSDTHRVEEITIHDGTGDNWSAPRIGYDFVNKQVVYAVGGTRFPERTQIAEKMESTIDGFNAIQVLSVIDGQGSGYIIQSAAFSPQRNFLLTQKYDAIAYKFSNIPAALLASSNAPSFSAQIIDPKNNTAGGVVVARYANGAVGQFRTVNGKTEPVRLPAAYTEHLQSKYQEILTVTSAANATLQRAQQAEREYLYKACNGKSSIRGLEQVEYTRICTWRDQFKEPYATASAKYQKQLEVLRQNAASAEQQRLLQQQITTQQYMLQQQRDQQAWNDLNQASRQLQQQTQQTLRGVQSWQAPQVQPITPPGGNRVVCNTIGSITTCR
jgi:hypothetical protein